MSRRQALSVTGGAAAAGLIAVAGCSGVAARASTARASAARAQILTTIPAIHAATGRVPDLFRAPYGAWSPFVLAQCARTGMTPLGWSVDPRDWSRPGVPSIVANIMRNTHTGSIILEHDGGGDRSQTVAALKIVIPRLLAVGYHFRTP
jgi:peptidoglycan-N-acetylglucosamine deacetylase